MSTGSLRLDTGYSYIDVAVVHFDWECIEIVAAAGKTASTFECITPSVPIALENSVSCPPTNQRIAHMGALIVGGVDFVLVVEQCYRTIGYSYSDRLSSRKILD